MILLAGCGGRNVELGGGHNLCYEWGDVHILEVVSQNSQLAMIQPIVGAMQERERRTSHLSSLLPVC